MGHVPFSIPASVQRNRVQSQFGEREGRTKTPHCNEELQIAVYCIYSLDLEYIFAVWTWSIYL